MILLPAIDLKDGQCVRLYQGDYNKVTAYSSDPVEVARRFVSAGAGWLHIVDLDGARAGQPINSALIARICQEIGLKIELGGGMRMLEHIESAFALGVERVILGTAVLTNRQLLNQALQRWPERIVAGLDARDGLIAISGWHETSNIKATELARELSLAGVPRFIYTDIARDGAMQGPNRAALSELQASLKDTSGKLIAAGGVSSLADLLSLAELDIEGAIIGKALYTEAIDLAEAVRVIEGKQPDQAGRSSC